MQRDWELMRDILSEASRKSPGERMIHTDIRGYFPLHVGDHIAVLSDAGCLKASIVRARGYVMWAAVTGVTVTGLQLLEKLQSRLPAVRR